MRKSLLIPHSVIVLSAIALLNVFISRSAHALPFVYVTQQGPDTVSVIDAATNTLFETITTIDQFPRDVAIDPDGNRAYIAMNSLCPPDIVRACVNVIDTDPSSATFNQFLFRIPVGDGNVAQGVAITPDGARVYVTNQGLFDNNPDTVSVIDAATNTVIANEPVGLSPDGVAITPDGTRAYVANTGPATFQPGTVSVIDTTSNTITTITASVGDNPRGVAITPDGNRAYITNDTTNPLRVIDTNATSPDFNTVVASTSVVGADAFRIAITPDGSRAYVTIRGNDLVQVVDTDPSSANFNTVVGTINLAAGSNPHGIALTADGTRAYVANFTPAQQGAGTVSVIDTDPDSPNFNTVIDTVEVGGNPFGVAISPPLTVLIDIKPGSFPNSINLGSGGTTPVAILSEPDFDALDVVPESVRLASADVKVKGNGTPMSSSEDVNGDGLLDLVVHVETEALELTETDENTFLTGKTFDGTPVRGVDTVRIVP